MPKASRRDPRDFVSLDLDNPSFAAQIYANPIERNEQHELIWSRRPQDAAARNHWAAAFGCSEKLEPAGCLIRMNCCGGLLLGRSCRLAQKHRAAVVQQSADVD